MPEYSVQRVCLKWYLSRERAFCGIQALKVNCYLSGCSLRQWHLYKLWLSICSFHMEVQCSNGIPCLNESNYSQSTYLHENFILYFLLNHQNLSLFWGSHIAVSGNVTRCSVIEKYQHFTEACCLHYHPEVTVWFYQNHGISS
jgi:hypothetical protein